MLAIVDFLARFVTGRPWVTSLLLAAVTAFAVMGYVDPTWISRRISPEVEEDRGEEQVSAAEVTSRSIPDVDPFSLQNADVILVVDGDSFFTSNGAKALRAIVEQLEDLDQVQNVIWMDRVPILNIFGLPEPLFPRSEASPQRFAAARKKALEHPLVGGHLLSNDGSTLLLMIQMDWFFVQGDDDCTELLKGVAREACQAYPEVQYSFMVTGRVPSFLTAMETHEVNQWKYQLIGYGVIALMSLVLFRGIIAVGILALAPSVGVFWTLGFIRYLNYQDNPFNDVILPVLLSLVGLTDGVHLLVTIRRLRTAGSSTAVAAANGIREVGLACALTSLTTAIGFGSLTLAHHEIVREFGQCCVLGVLLTFVAVITVIPLACITPLGRRVHIGHNAGLIDRHLGRVTVIVDWVLKRRRFMSWTAIGATIVCLAICSVLRPDERNSNALPAESESARALVHMDQTFGGLEPGGISITWSDNLAEDSAEMLSVIAAADQLLQDETLIGPTLSLAKLVAALPGSGDIEERVSMIDLLPPPLKRAFYTPEFRQAEVLFRVQDLGIATYGPVFRRLETRLEELHEAHPEFSFELRGRAVRRWRNLYQIVVDLVTSLGTAAFIIFVVLAIVYRSLRIGLISIIPNMFPLALTGTYLVATGLALELVSVCAFTVCLGIAVDDTIHFLTRFEEERRKTDDIDLAIRRAFTHVGTALIMTTIVLVAGFGTVMFSDFRDHQIFASMGTLTIAAALFGDMLFLPALLAYFVRDRK
jgi:predicted RND superfamily exporter protein